jgi:hypothetical protein
VYIESNYPDQEGDFFECIVYSIFCCIHVSNVKNTGCNARKYAGSDICIRSIMKKSLHTLTIVVLNMITTGSDLYKCIFLEKCWLWH